MRLDGYLDGIRKDVSRPGGGWTFGLLSLLAVFLGPVVGAVTWEPVGWVWMLGWFMIHFSWGALGYYPRSLR